MPRCSRSCTILAATRFVIADSAMVVRVLHRSGVTVKDIVVFMLLRAARLESAEDIAHDGVDVAAAVVAEGGHPGIELAPSHENLAAGAVGGDRMGRVLE